MYKGKNKNATRLQVLSAKRLIENILERKMFIPLSISELYVTYYLYGAFPYGAQYVLIME